MPPINPAVQAPRTAVVATLLLAVLLNILPYPHWARFAHPDWVTLALFYWCLVLPRRIGVVSGWCCGLLLDLIHSTLPGQHAIGKALIALAASSGSGLLQLSPVWQQCAVVLALASLDTAIVVWIHHLANGVEFRLIYWQGALTTALLWPAAHSLLRAMRRRAN